MSNTQNQLREILPKAGLVYSEKSTLSEILSKPLIMPLKSITLTKISEMEKQAKEKGFIVGGTERPQTSLRLNQVKEIFEETTSEERRRAMDKEEEFNERKNKRNEYNSLVV